MNNEGQLPIEEEDNTFRDGKKFCTVQTERIRKWDEIDLKHFRESPLWGRDV